MEVIPMSAAAFPAPRAPKAPEALVAPAVKMTLVQFLRLAHELFGRYFPEPIVQMAGKNGDDLTNQVKALLCYNGWTRNEVGALTLSNASGMVCAFLRPNQGLFGLFQDWYGGFIYQTRFPTDQETCQKMIKLRMFFADDAQVELYKRNCPGISVAVINVNRMKVTEWYRHDADKRSDDFQDWKRIFERLFDQLDFSESWGYGEQMFDAIYDPCWQWTTESQDEVRTKLSIIANSSETEEEVRRRVRDELNYQSANIRVFKREANFLRPMQCFFVEIISPLGRSDRLVVNANL